MTPELDHLLSALEPPTDDNLHERLKFGLLCATRVAHLLEHPDAPACLQTLDAIVQDQSKRSGLPELVKRSEELANRHHGSKSLDGVGHAAVSATYACAKAIAGRSRQAAEYAAYAAVYGQGGYGATSAPAAFKPEFDWQAQQLKALLAARLLVGPAKGTPVQTAPRA